MTSLIIKDDEEAIVTKIYIYIIYQWMKMKCISILICYLCWLDYAVPTLQSDFVSFCLCFFPNFNFHLGKRQKCIVWEKWTNSCSLLKFSFFLASSWYFKERNSVKIITRVLDYTVKKIDYVKLIMDKNKLKVKLFIFT